MPALQNPQHEKFAQARAEFVERIKAYQQAGFVPDRGNANRLEKRTEVKARIAELLEEAARYTDIRRVKTLVNIDAVGDFNVIDILEPVLDSDGQDTGRLRLKDLTKLPRKPTAALGTIKLDEDGRVKEITPHDKNQANFVLLKYFGGLPEPERTDITNIFNVLGVDDQRLLADFIEALPGGPRRVGGPAPGERQPAGEVS